MWTRRELKMIDDYDRKSQILDSDYDGREDRVTTAQAIGVPPPGYTEEDELEFFHPGHPSNFGHS